MGAASGSASTGGSTSTGAGGTGRGGASSAAADGVVAAISRHGGHGITAANARVEAMATDTARAGGTRIIRCYRWCPWAGGPDPPCSAGCMSDSHPADQRVVGKLRVAFVNASVAGAGEPGSVMQARLALHGGPRDNRP